MLPASQRGLGAAVPSAQCECNAKCGIAPASPCTTSGYNSKVNDFGNFRELNLPCNLRLMSNESVNSPGAAKAVRSRYAEVQSAARFPVKLPIHIKSQNGESDTESDNISANGVLFHHDVDASCRSCWSRGGRASGVPGPSGPQSR